MSRLTLNISFPAAFTMIPNGFLDHSMPRANGEFVKIYLYLLRAAEGGEKEVSPSGIADRIFCTENDVLRALRYWEKEQLLDLEENDGIITGITLFPGRDQDDGKEKARRAPEDASLPPQISMDDREDKISMERALALRENEEIRELLFIAEQYLGKPLTQTEMQRLLFLYDDLHFTTDLIDYLIEYCVSKNHKSIYYIMKVAKNWYADGINTVRAARASVNRYNKDYYEILKAFGITGRNPIDDEISYMKKWIENYGFPMELITEACSRTVLRAGKPSFSYADGILKNWEKEGVRSAEEVARLDALHEQKSREAADRKAGSAAAKQGAAGQAAKKPNAFNSFTSQHQYDFDDLEKTLSKGMPE